MRSQLLLMPSFARARDPSLTHFVRHSVRLPSASHPEDMQRRQWQRGDNFLICIRREEREKTTYSFPNSWGERSAVNWQQRTTLKGDLFDSFRLFFHLAVCFCMEFCRCVPTRLLRRESLWQTSLKLMRREGDKMWWTAGRREKRRKCNQSASQGCHWEKGKQNNKPQPILSKLRVEIKEKAERPDRTTDHNNITSLLRSNRNKKE